VNRQEIAEALRAVWSMITTPATTAVTTATTATTPVTTAVTTVTTAITTVTTTKGYHVRLSDADRRWLQKFVRSGKAPAHALTHARILLKADTTPRRCSHQTQAPLSYP
jgi:hypothetical protein